MWKIRTLTDKAEIHRFLQRDRVWSAYAIAGLENGEFERCEWHLAEGKTDWWALGLLYRGFDPPVLFTVGHPKGVEAILAESLTPPIALFTAKPGHLAAIRAFYTFGTPERMLRMTVPIRHFKPVEGRPRRLRAADLDALKGLYSTRMPPALSAEQIEKGVFYGLEVHGQLISAAGTHVIAPKYKVAAVGNVVTHPEHRGAGYAALCSSAVTEELLAGGLDVVLNVGEKDEAAKKIYERLGYRSYCRFVEVLGKRT